MTRTIGSPQLQSREVGSVPDTRARIAVVGAGWWSTYTHIPALLRNDAADLVAICDTNAQALARATDAFAGPAAYADLDELLLREDLTGVIVAVPHAAHHAAAAKCLDAGLHVLLEKPMTLTAVDARDLVRRASGVGAELIVGYPWHFTPTAIRAREVVTSGELGRPQFVQSTFCSMVIEYYRGHDAAYQPVFQWTVTGPGAIYADPRASGGGQGHLQITHSSGLMFFVSGLRPERVSAFMANFDVPVDLVDGVAVRFDGGAVGVLGSTGNLRPHDPGQLDVRVYCEAGYVTLDAIEGILTITRHDGNDESVRIEGDDTYPRFATSANLVDVCLGRAPNGSPASIALASVELLDAAYRSAAADGAPVSVSDLYA